MDVPAAQRQARDGFVALIARYGDDIPLDEAAAWMAAEERPGTAPIDILEQLDALAGEIRMGENAEPYEAIARLNHALFIERGFTGSTEDYDAPENSMIDLVLSRRTGLPILLSLVYVEVARRVGVEIDGIGFPSHFLVSPRYSEPRFFIDPFHAGRVLREDHLSAWLRRQTDGAEVPAYHWERLLSALSGRMWMVRINNNLKASYLRRRNLPGALRAVDRLLALRPDIVEHRRERGLLRIELGLEQEGAEDLEAYLAAHPHAEGSEDLARQLADLKKS